MPKKFVGENSKAAAARARKASAKEVQNAKKQRELEEQYWKEDDKLIIKKQQRKEEQERKRQQQLEKKQEAKMLLEKEMSSVTKSTAKNQPPPKVTRAQIECVKASKPAPKKEVVETHLTVPLEENINRLAIDGEEARSITEAIAVLSSKPEYVDKHPEKHMKAAYAAFEERRLKQLKEENPTLRLSQLKQMLFKEWQKSPENPLNQA